MRPIVRRFKDVIPKEDVCGLVAQLISTEDLSQTSVALAAMLKPTIPHWHPEPVVEIYLVVSGRVILHVGNKRIELEVNDAVIIPPEYVHFAIPVLHSKVAAITTPAWTPETQIVVSDEEAEKDRPLASGVDYEKDGYMQRWILMKEIIARYRELPFPKTPENLGQFFNSCVPPRSDLTLDKIKALEDETQRFLCRCLAPKSREPLSPQEILKVPLQDLRDFLSVAGVARF